MSAPVTSSRLPGLNLMVGSFLPRLRLPNLAGQAISPADLVDEDQIGICIYNPADVNPFPLPPPGVDLPARFAMLQERGVRLYVISGLTVPRLRNWLDRIGLDIQALSDAAKSFSAEVGIPIKEVDGHHFRTHAAFVLQEDRILSMLPETDLIRDFPRLLVALDIAEGREPQIYDLPDKPWYQTRRERIDTDSDEDETMSEFDAVGD